MISVLHSHTDEAEKSSSRDFAVLKLTPEEWKDIAKISHLVMFNETRDPEMNRVDFTLLYTKNNYPAAYLTFMELDSETAYWGHGGVFPNIAKTFEVLKVYNTAIEYSKQKYKRVFTYIKNDNRSMLKMALHVGFKIIGIKFFKNEVYLQHILELGE